MRQQLSPRHLVENLRELDRSRLLDVEREVLGEALGDQTLDLGKDELAGLTELWNRAGLVGKNVDLRSVLVRVHAG